MSPPEVNYDALANDRISSTKIYQYDLITAISQESINNQLGSMYKVNKSLHTLSIRLDDPDDDWAGIEAKLGPSKVELQIGTDNRAAILFIYLTSGKLKFWKGNGPKAKQETVEIKDWVIALRVNLAFELKKFKELPQDIQDRLKVLGDYSVRQLLVDFTSAHIADREKSRSKLDMTDEALVYFEIFMGKYFKQRAASSDDSVIHYLPQANSDKEVYAIPNLPPTDLMFQNVPFVVSGNDQEVGPNTMLVYLQMTQGHSFPHELLPISANWVVPDTTTPYDGTVALSKATFLDGWLMHKLAEFNRKSTWATDVASWRDIKTQTIFWKTQVDLRGHMNLEVGEKVNDKDVDFSFITAKTSDVPSEIKAKVADSEKGSWYKFECSSSKSKPGNMWFKGVKMEGNTNNWCFFREGLNAQGKGEIVIIGKTKVYVSVELDALPKDEGWAEGNWQISLLLDGVHKGALKIRTEPSEITPSVSKYVDKGLLSTDHLPPIVTHITDGLGALSMVEVVKDLNATLGGSWNFCLPGGSDFFIDKALFNREQDLLCQLVYKAKF